MVVVVAHQVHMPRQLGRVLDHVPAVQMCHLLPAAVVLWDPSRAYRHSATHSPQAQFVVACAGLPLDPFGFALGGRVLPDYVVREGCNRVVKLKLMAEAASYIPNQPARPRIWEDNQGSAGVPLRGLRACEARWGSVTGPNAARTRTTADLALPAPSQRQVRPRPLPARRVFEVNDLRPPVLPAGAGRGDVLLEGVPAAPVPWASVWGRLKDIELDRQHRVLAWRILHG